MALVQVPPPFVVTRKPWPREYALILPHRDHLDRRPHLLAASLEHPQQRRYSSNRVALQEPRASAPAF